MNPTFYPCIWFDGQAQEACNFYCSIFPGSQKPSDNGMVTIFEIAGTRFMALNGGPAWKPTPAVSYYFYTGNETLLKKYYDALSDGGQVLMPLGRYDWSPAYAWVIDRFGVSWQMDMDDLPTTQKIVPSLLFVNEKQALVKEAMTLYASIFPDSVSLMEAPYPPGSATAEGMLLFAQYRINGNLMNAMSSVIRHDFDFSPGNSFVVLCDTQEAIDQYWHALGHDGQFEKCGWLRDKFGVSWQIVPSILPSLMADPTKRERVMAAFLSMSKFEIDKLMV